MRAELISIGTELLLGAITDTNATHIAKSLSSIGLDLIYETTVGDNEKRIAEVIDHALTRVDVVITTGGLGPTVDDVTREAIARATGHDLEYQQTLMDQITDRFARFGARMSDNNRRQALIPRGAHAIENPVGTAPSFILETDRGVVMSLPGVPREMMYLLEHNLLPWLIHYMGSTLIIESRVLRTAGIGESQIDAKIADLMMLENPTVGLAAHTGQTDIRITAKAASHEAAQGLIAPIADELTTRLGSWIYASGDDSIEEVVLSLLGSRNATLAVKELESGVLISRLRAVPSADLVLTYAEAINDVTLLQQKYGSLSLGEVASRIAQEIRVAHDTDYALVVVSHETADGARGQEHGTAIAAVSRDSQRTRKFGWTSQDRTDSTEWAATHALALLRRLILKSAEPE